MHPLKMPLRPYKQIQWRNLVMKGVDYILQQNIVVKKLFHTTQEFHELRKMFSSAQFSMLYLGSKEKYFTAGGNV